MKNNYLRITAFFFLLYFLFLSNTKSTDLIYNDKSITGLLDDSTKIILSIDSVCGQIGDTVCVTVKVENFIDIEYVLGKINFDPEVLEFIDVFSRFYINLRLDVDGNLALYKLLGSPTTIPDGEEFMKLCFVLKGKVGDESSIFASDFNFVKGDDDIYPECIPGEVCIKAPEGLYANYTYCGSDNEIPESIINFKVFNGKPPYTYQLADKTGNQMKNGTVESENTRTSLSNLLPDTFKLLVIDSNQDSFNMDIFLTNTSPLQFDSIYVQDKCMGIVNGVIKIKIRDKEPPSYSVKWSNLLYNINSLSGLSPGTYGVTVTDRATGCKTDTSVNVGYLEFSIDSYTKSDASCYGECDGSIEVNVTKNNDLPIRYEWSNGSESNKIYNLCKNKYDLKVSNTNYCFFTRSFYVFQPDQLDVQVDKVQDIYSSDQLGAITISSGNDNYTYSWTGPDGFYSEKKSPDDLVAGCYTLTVLDTISNCSMDTTICITNRTNVDDIYNDNKIEIYPNPGDDFITINLAKVSSKSCKISIFDLSGKEVSPVSKHYNTNLIKKDISQLKNGMYFIKVQNNNNIEFLKFIKR